MGSRGVKGLRKECACSKVRMRAGEKRSQMCQWALTQKQTLWGGGALELGDLRLLENGGEHSDALFSDGVASETASKG